MRIRAPMILIAAAALVACDYRTPPTGPTTVTVTTTVSSNGNNNPTPTPTPSPTPTPTPGGSGRTPDPTSGILPLPTYGAQLLQTYAASAAGQAALMTSCPSFAFLDGLVDLLRQRDTRWGYACKRGNCADIALDVVSYHATAGPDLTGVAGVINVDVVQDFCGLSPVAQWSPFAFDAAALWSTRGRF